MVVRQLSEVFIEAATLHIVINLIVHQLCGDLLGDCMPHLVVAWAHIPAKAQEEIFATDKSAEVKLIVPDRELEWERV